MKFNEYSFINIQCTKLRVPATYIKRNILINDNIISENKYNCKKKDKIFICQVMINYEIVKNLSTIWVEMQDIQ